MAGGLSGACLLHSPVPGCFGEQPPRCFRSELCYVSFTWGKVEIWAVLKDSKLMVIHTLKKSLNEASYVSLKCLTVTVNNRKIQSWEQIQGALKLVTPGMAQDAPSMHGRPILHEVF